MGRAAGTCMAAMLLFVMTTASPQRCEALSSPCLGDLGDVDADGAVDVVDVQCLVLSALASVAGDAAPACEAGPSDLDCSGSIDVVDVVLDTRLALGLGLAVSVDADANGCPDGCDAAGCGDGWCGGTDTCASCPADCACDDADPCTDDACTATGCEHSPALGVDGCPMQFFGFEVLDLQPASAMIHFWTTQASTCAVHYGTSPDALDNTATAPNMQPGQFFFEHTVPLEPLLPDTTYYYRGAATTADGASYTSSLHDFHTPPAPAGDLVDVALATAGTTIAGVSSNYGNAPNDSTWGALRAIDGLMSTAWATNGDGDDAWLELDLGQPRTIVRVGIRSRKMADGTSIVLSSQLTFDGATTIGPLSTPDPDVTYTFDLDTPLVAQHVRFDALATTGGNTGLVELQLFAPGP